MLLINISVNSLNNKSKYYKDIVILFTIWILENFGYGHYYLRCCLL